MTLKSILKNAWFYTKIVGIALVLAIILRIFVFDSFKIPSDSMEPELLAGDVILVDKLVYGARLFKAFHRVDREAF